jgi:FtsH Extracellular
MRTYQPSPRGQAPTVAWRHWLLPLGAAAGIVALLALSPAGPSGIPLSYSQFLNDVGAGSVRAVTINPAGQVTGRRDRRLLGVTMMVRLSGDGHVCLSGPSVRWLAGRERGQRAVARWGVSSRTGCRSGGPGACRLLSGTR